MSNSQNQSGNQGKNWLSKINVFGILNKKNNNTKKNNSKNVVLATEVKPALPVTAEVKVPANNTAPSQAGGVASVNYSVPPNMQQPSNKIMEWATTAGVPLPTSGMRNVAHGGKRRTHRRRHSKHKKHTRKHHSMKRKTHKRRHHKRRN